MKKLILLGLLLSVVASSGAVIESGWTRTNNAAVARAALGVPGLTNNNVFTGTSNRFSGNVVATNLWDKDNVKFWGAKGDGVTDDTAAIQASLDTGHSKADAGTYVINGTLRLTVGGTTLKGANSATTIFLQTSNAPALVNDGANQVEISGIRFKSGPLVNAVAGIDFTNLSLSTFHDVDSVVWDTTTSGTTGWTNAIKLTDCYWNTFYNGSFQSRTGGTAIFINGANSTKFIGGTATSVYGNGLAVTNANNFVVIGMAFDGYLTNSVTISGPYSNNVIAFCRMEIIGSASAVPVILDSSSRGNLLLGNLYNATGGASISDAGSGNEYFEQGFEKKIAGRLRTSGNVIAPVFQVYSNDNAGITIASRNVAEIWTIFSDFGELAFNNQNYGEIFRMARAGGVSTSKGTLTNGISFDGVNFYTITNTPADGQIPTATGTGGKMKFAVASGGSGGSSTFGGQFVSSEGGTNFNPILVFTNGSLTLSNETSKASIVSTNGSTVWSNSVAGVAAITNGTLGIGTLSPTYKLHIRAAEGSNPTDYLMAIDNADVTAGQGNGLRIEAGNGSSDFSLGVVNNAQSALFTVRGDGNVGFGVFNPLYKAHVSGTILSSNASGGLYWLTDGAGNATNSGNIQTATLNVTDTINATNVALKYPGTFASSSLATNRAIFIAASGYTNNLTVGGKSQDADVYFSGTNVSLNEPSTAGLYGFPAGTIVYGYAYLKPGWSLTGTSMSGQAIGR